MITAEDPARPTLPRDASADLLNSWSVGRDGGWDMPKSFRALNFSSGHESVMHRICKCRFKAKIFWESVVRGLVPHWTPQAGNQGPCSRERHRASQEAKDKTSQVSYTQEWPGGEGREPRDLITNRLASAFPGRCQQIQELPESGHMGVYLLNVQKIHGKGRKAGSPSSGRKGQCRLWGTAPFLRGLGVL